MQEVLDGVPRVDAMAERAVAGPFDDSDHEIGDIQVTRALRAAFACLDGVDLISQDQGACREVSSHVFERREQICNASRIARVGSWHRGP